MAITRLVKLVAPPAQPLAREGGKSLWKVRERQLGCSLPSDYLDFCSTYGSGVLTISTIVKVMIYSNRSSPWKQTRRFFAGAVGVDGGAEEVEYRPLLQA